MVGGGDGFEALEEAAEVGFVAGFAASEAAAVYGDVVGGHGVVG